MQGESSCGKYELRSVPDDLYDLYDLYDLRQSGLYDPRRLRQSVLIGAVKGAVVVTADLGVEPLLGPPSPILSCLRFGASAL